MRLQFRKQEVVSGTVKGYFNNSFYGSFLFFVFGNLTKTTWKLHRVLFVQQIVPFMQRMIPEMFDNKKERKLIEIYENKL